MGNQSICSLEELTIEIGQTSVGVKADIQWRVRVETTKLTVCNSPEPIDVGAGKG